MQKRLFQAIVLAMVALVTGCAAGTKFERQPDQRLVLGKTTYEEIVQVMGKPLNEGAVAKNAKSMKRIAYGYAGSGAPAYDGVVASNAQSFHFYDNKLVGYDYTSSYKTDSTDIDISKLNQILKGTSTRADVRALLGPAGGQYLFPLISSPEQQADSYLYSQTTRGFGIVKFYRKSLTVTYDPSGIVSNVEFEETGNK